MSQVQARPTNELLGLNGICQQFHDSLILDGITLSVGRGELCAVLGENGAGKTALMNIIAGINRADSGEIWLDGKLEKIDGPQRAFELGIAMVSQEPAVVKMLTVGQSIYLNREITHRGLPFINRKVQDEKVREVLHFMAWDVSPYTRVSDLTPMQRKLLMLARALRFNCKLLILDDMTANFEHQEVPYILNLIKRIHQRGVTILLISHKIDEVLALANHAVILSEGQLIADFMQFDGSEIATLAKQMTGPDCHNRYPRTGGDKGDVLLSADRLYSTRHDHNLKDISLYVREGEIVGVVDFQSATKATLVDLLSGTARPSSGTLTVCGHVCNLRKPCDALKAGLTVLDAENTSNLYLGMDACFNVSIPNLSNIGRKVMVYPKEIRRFATDYLDKVNLRKIPISQPVRTLSYGNQQKLALSRVVGANHKVLIMVDPTAGVDNSSKVDMYNIMNRLVHKRKGILLFSADIQELSGMCDRVYVIYKSTIITELSGRNLTPQRLLDCATGNA